MSVIIRQNGLHLIERRSGVVRDDLFGSQAILGTFGYVLGRDAVRSDSRAPPQLLRVDFRGRAVTPEVLLAHAVILAAFRRLATVAARPAL